MTETVSMVPYYVGAAVVVALFVLGALLPNDE